MLITKMNLRTSNKAWKASILHTAACHFVPMTAHPNCFKQSFLIQMLLKSLLHPEPRLQALLLKFLLCTSKKFITWRWYQALFNLGWCLHSQGT